MEVGMPTLIFGEIPPEFGGVKPCREDYPNAPSMAY